MASYVTVVKDDKSEGWCAAYVGEDREPKKCPPKKQHYEAVVEARYMALHNSVEYVG